MGAIIRSFFFFLLAIIAIRGEAFNVEARWNQLFQKEVVLKCNNGDYFCQDLCGKKLECIFKEKVCRDCIGTSIYLSFIFEYLGKSVVRIDKEASDYELIDLFKSGNFTTLTSKSIYNHVDGFDSVDLRAKFSDLCKPLSDPYPVIVFEKEKGVSPLKNPKFLICNQNSEEIRKVDIFYMGNFSDGVEIYSN
jgi:hypothetical protein